MFEFNHLKKLDLTYIQHLTQAGNIFIKLQISAIKLCIHAIYPDVFSACINDFLKFYCDTRKSCEGLDAACERE